MNQWTFVIAAYAVMLIATGGLLASVFAAMRRAEAAADAFKRRD